MNHDQTYWVELAERYFQAETSEAEEAQLRRFLCTDEARDARFDEVRATMSYLHVARTKRAKSGMPLLIALAACLSAIAFLGWHQYQQHNISCVRIAGQEIEADASLLMQRQMTEMFNLTDK